VACFGGGLAQHQWPSRTGRSHRLRDAHFGVVCASTSLSTTSTAKSFSEDRSPFAQDHHHRRCGANARGPRTSTRACAGVARLHDRQRDATALGRAGGAGRGVIGLVQSASCRERVRALERLEHPRLLPKLLPNRLTRTVIAVDTPALTPSSKRL